MIIIKFKFEIEHIHTQTKHSKDVIMLVRFILNLIKVLIKYNIFLVQLILIIIIIF